MPNPNPFAGEKAGFTTEVNVGEDAKKTSTLNPFAPSFKKEGANSNPFGGAVPPSGEGSSFFSKEEIVVETPRTIEKNSNPFGPTIPSTTATASSGMGFFGDRKKPATKGADIFGGGFATGTPADNTDHDYAREMRLEDEEDEEYEEYQDGYLEEYEEGYEEEEEGEEEEEEEEDSQGGYEEEEDEEEASPEPTPEPMKNPFGGATGFTGAFNFGGATPQKESIIGENTPSATPDTVKSKIPTPSVFGKEDKAKEASEDGMIHRPQPKMGSATGLSAKPLFPEKTTISSGKPTPFTSTSSFTKPETTTTTTAPKSSLFKPTTATTTTTTTPTKPESQTASSSAVPPTAAPAPTPETNTAATQADITPKKATPPEPKLSAEDVQRKEFFTSVIQSISDPVQGEELGGSESESSDCAEDDAIVDTIIEFKAALAAGREAEDSRNEQIERNAAYLEKLQNSLRDGPPLPPPRSLTMRRRTPLTSLPLPISMATPFMDLPKEGADCIASIHQRMTASRHRIKEAVEVLKDVEKEVQEVGLETEDVTLTTKGGRSMTEGLDEAVGKAGVAATEMKWEALALRKEMEKTARESAVQDTRSAEEVLKGCSFPQAAKLIENMRAISSSSDLIKVHVSKLADDSRRHQAVQHQAKQLLLRARIAEGEILNLRKDDVRLKEFYEKAQQLKIPCGDSPPDIFKVFLCLSILIHNKKQDALQDHIVNPPKALPDVVVCTPIVFPFVTIYLFFQVPFTKEYAAELAAERQENIAALGRKLDGRASVVHAVPGLVGNEVLTLPPTPTPTPDTKKARKPLSRRKLAMTKTCRYLLSTAGISHAVETFEDNGITDETTLRQLCRKDYLRLGLTPEEISALGALLSGVEGARPPRAPVAATPFTPMTPSTKAVPRSSAAKPWRAPGRLKSTSTDKVTESSYQRLLDQAESFGISVITVSQLLRGKKEVSALKIDAAQRTVLSKLITEVKNDPDAPTIPVLEDPEPTPVKVPETVAATKVIQMTKLPTDKNLGVAFDDSCVVTKLADGGCAARAGVTMDMKALKVNGTSVASKAALVDALKTAGDNVALEVEDKNAPPPAPASAPAPAFAAKPSEAKTKTITITKADGKTGMKVGDTCAVDGVMDGYPAKAAGVVVGMKVLKVGSTAVTSRAQFQTLAKEAPTVFTIEVEDTAAPLGGGFGSGAPAATPFGAATAKPAAFGAAASAAPAFGTTPAKKTKTITITKADGKTGVKIQEDCVVSGLQDGPAKAAGVTVGMKVLKVGSTAVSSTKQFQTAVKEAPTVFTIEVEDTAAPAAAAFGAGAPAATPFGAATAKPAAFGAATSAAPAFGTTPAKKTKTITITKADGKTGVKIQEDCVVSGLQDGPAKAAGVTVGMKVLKVGSTAVSSKGQFQTAVKEAPTVFTIEVEDTAAPAATAFGAGAPAATPFGATPASSSAATGGFGGAATPAFGAASSSAAGGFGAATGGFGAAKPAATGGFGATPASSSAAATGGFGGFGAAKPASSGAATGGFGAPAFGAAPTAAAPAFGATPAASVGGFGATPTPAAGSALTQTLTIAKAASEKVGIKTDEHHRISALMPTGPAKRAGAVVGMKIIKVNGTAMEPATKFETLVPNLGNSFTIEVSR